MCEGIPDNSAGIGRTGTYIALDRLIEEGEATGYVDVFDCVMSMRKQRVSMVQTPEQYMYLHQALVHCLVFDSHLVTAETIGEYVQTTRNNVYSQMYQQLKQTVEKESGEYLGTQGDSLSLTNRNSIRRREDVPGDKHRVLLYLDRVSEDSNNINAVYLASFLRLDCFIVAKSPLPNTTEDFVCMLYQEKCICIVALDQCKQKQTNNATYLPAEHEQTTYGHFTVTCLNVEVRPAYILRKLKLGHAGKHDPGTHTAYHFQFTAWKHNEPLPRDPEIFVKFVTDVEDYASRLDNSHVVVHCMPGSERSGLFCAVYNLIQKMRLEKQVSVINMLRRVRERRRTAVSSMEHVKFCYQALNAYVKMAEVLSSRNTPTSAYYENTV